MVFSGWKIMRCSSGTSTHSGVFLIVEGRGISRGSQVISHHPLPEKPEDDLPNDYIRTVHEAIRQYNVEPSVESSSGRSSPTIDQSMFSASNGWTTETGSESVYSFGEDDFDRQASQKVRYMFKEIDDMLYEGRQKGNQQIYNECKEWVNMFPHLRICGAQLLEPQDQGFRHIPSEATARPSTGTVVTDMADMDDLQGIAVQGTHLDILSPPEAALRSNSPNSPFSYLEEEIFECDGYVEEYLAYDTSNKQVDEDARTDYKLRYTLSRRKRLGLPPITPNASFRDNLGAEIFAMIWSEVNSWIRHSLKVQVDQALQEEADKQLAEMDFDDVESPLPLRDLPPPSREGFSGFRPSMGRYPSTLAASSFMDYNALNGVMTITTKPILERANTSFQERSDDSPVRAGSSMMMASGIRGRPPSTRYGYRQPSARGRVARLAPIPNYDRSRTPALDADVGIRGTRLQPDSRLSSPPHVLSPQLTSTYRIVHKHLPPLSHPQEAFESSSPHASAKAKKGLGSRASSAVIDENGRRTSKMIQFSPESRPNTTHTFRADTPFGALRRSSTPMGTNNNFRTSGSALGNPVIPGVVGYGITSSASQMDPHVNHPVEMEDEEEWGNSENFQIPRTSSWGHSGLNPSNNPYARGRGKLGSLVR
ncbi:protein FAM149A-like isoform X2 [Branchiostoma lanceolatum]|uniref:protein FAM149A-like isoform X2 n=1 Tax=Branchiostoma lanceolatum TaxID=7740 RepID=UPI0034518001